MMRLPDSPDLVIMGDPLLFQQHQQVCVDDILTDNFQHNLQTLRQKQIEAKGIGIAAPQIGWGQGYWMGFYFQKGFMKQS